MSDQIADVNQSTETGLANILGSISEIRKTIKPKHILGHVLPDGRVVLANGDIVEGIRGVPAPAAIALPLPRPSASHVKGSILGNGTVVADGKIVDGIQGASMTVPYEEVDAETLKHMEQDQKLGTLEEKGKTTIFLDLIDVAASFRAYEAYATSIGKRSPSDNGRRGVVYESCRRYSGR